MRLFSTVAVLALLLGAPALAETSVGVTAAVNPDATGTVGSTVRTISLGDSVVFNQRIETGAASRVLVRRANVPATLCDLEEFGRPRLVAHGLPCRRRG